MAEIRRAFLFATLGRYLVMAINIVATLVMARLLGPGEFGVSVLGMSVIAIAEAIRALGGGSYLVQHRDLDARNIRTSFTVSLIVTIVLTAALALFAGPLARGFDTPALEPYLYVAGLGYLPGPFATTILALMGRRMAFGMIAFISVVTATVNATASVGLGLLGFSYMSFAWANAVSTFVSMLIYLLAWRDRGIFRPSLRGWRHVVAFGAYDSATAIIAQLGESLPFILIGKLLNADAVGLAQRTVLLCLFPERVILAGVSAVALPAFAKQVREGTNLKGNYLRAIEMITAAQWPALLLLIALADPIVTMLLGAHWREAIPLVRILAAALLFSFPVTLHYPVLVAVGAIRFLPPIVLMQVSVSIIALLIAAREGLHAAALSMLVIVPCNGLLSLLLVRHFVGFRWREFAGAMGQSAIAAAMSGAVPLAVMLTADWQSRMAILHGALAVGGAGAGWFGGVVLTGHPLLHEIVRFSTDLRHRPRVAEALRIGARMLRRAP